jgi:hypothetical protein
MSYSSNLRRLSSDLLKLDKGAHRPVLAMSYESNALNYFTKLPVYGTSYFSNLDGLLFAHRVFFYEKPAGQSDWRVIAKQLENTGWIVLTKETDYVASYMIYGRDRITDPSFCFAYYLLHTDADKLEPWLKLEIDDAKFRVFRIVKPANAAPVTQ